MFSSFTQTDCFLFQESFIHACAHMHTNYIPHTWNVFRGKVFQVNTLEMERSMLLPELSLSGFLYHEQLQKLLTVFHTKSGNKISACLQGLYWQKDHLKLPRMNIDMKWKFKQKKTFFLILDQGRSWCNHSYVHILIKGIYLFVMFLLTMCHLKIHINKKDTDKKGLTKV